MWIAVILIAVLTFLIYKISKPPKDIWRDHGVRQINIATVKDNLDVFLGKKTIADIDHKVYKVLERSSEKFCGTVEMQRPMLLVRDLEILKKIFIKDFDHFADRRTFGSTQAQPVVKKMLANLEGEEWKGVRSALSPTFTTGKIRRMMEFFNKIGNEWVEYLKSEIAKSQDDYIFIDVTHETTHYTVDVIAAAVFGMDAGTIRNPKSKFAEMCQRISATTVKAIIKFIISLYLPTLAALIRLKLIDAQALDYFESIMAQGMKERMDGSVKRNDFLQLIAEARKGELKAIGSDELSSYEKEAQISAGTKKNWLGDDVVANAAMIGFFFAGFNTTSNFIGFCMYCLALNPEVQDKLRDEVDSKLFKGTEEGNIDYDEINTLIYLDMFTCEVLRKYPPLLRLERKCVKEYHDQESSLRVPKDALVCVPVGSIHNDSMYYEQPDKFYPEHFTPEKKATRSPYAYLPFGQGPRNCVGMRFALVKSKSAIAHLVHHFFIEPSPKTPVPLQTQPVGFGVNIPANLELKLRKR